MQEVTFTLRVLTPLFLAGAGQNSAELRAPAFRGLLRYWQRALVSGTVGVVPHYLEKVKKCETAVFGSTEIGSAVAMKVSGVSHEPREFIEQVSVRVGDTWQSTGKGYLFWSMARSGSAARRNFKPARWYFPAETSFRLTLSARDTHASSLVQAVTALWLLTQLGGIGSRARRCAGSLAVQAVTGNPTTLSFASAEDVPALKRQIEEGIEAAKKSAQQLLATVESGQSSQHLPGGDAQFDTLAPHTCRIWLLQDEQPWVSAEQAMQRLGEHLQRYRSHIPLPQRTIFGLPLSPIILNTRRSSPLLLRVTELQGKKYVGIAVLFKTVDDNVSLEDYRLIEQWTNAFRGRQEVVL